jgi:aryl-alcohol dehydrogenase-like predicted oxidoreductase
LTVSVVGLGCNSFGDTLDPSDVDTVVGAAIDSGITLFDTADIYGGAPGQGEELLGAALGKRRDDVVLATKAGMDTQGLAGPAWECRGSRRYLHRAVEGSLRRLQTDHIDLLQLHEPDPITPIDETLAALDDLVRSGKVRYIGSSNFTAWQVVDADWTARTSQLSRFVAAQNPYSLLNRGIEADLVPVAEKLGIGILPYYPLASGLLTGKYQRNQPPPAGSRLAGRQERLAVANWDVIEGLTRVANERGISLLTLAIGALAAQPGVASVISGATSPQQIAANVAAGEWVPTAADLAAIDEVAPPGR